MKPFFIRFERFKAYTMSKCFLLRTAEKEKLVFYKTQCQTLAPAPAVAPQASECDLVFDDDFIFNSI